MGPGWASGRGSTDDSPEAKLGVEARGNGREGLSGNRSKHPCSQADIVIHGREKVVSAANQAHL
jgi:hypothetical protein